MTMRVSGVQVRDPANSDQRHPPRQLNQSSRPTLELQSTAPMTQLKTKITYFKYHLKVVLSLILEPLYADEW